MKIIIASGIHGSAAHGLKFIKACYLEQAETVLLLGDLLDDNREVAEMLNGLSCHQVVFCSTVTLMLLLGTGSPAFLLCVRAQSQDQDGTVVTVTWF